METIKFCPKCKSTNVTFGDTVYSNNRFPTDRCRDCGFSLRDFPEIDKEEVKTLEKVKKKNSKKS